jgi:hypothetical protein
MDAFVPADGRDRGAGKRSAIKTRRLHPRLVAGRRLSSGVSSLCELRGPMPPTAWPQRTVLRTTRQFTRHTLSSKFRRTSNKTNDRGLRQVTHNARVGSATLVANRASTVPNYSTHVSSNFRSNLLKTNNWCTHDVTLITGLPVSTVSRAWEISPRLRRDESKSCRISHRGPSRMLARPSLLSSADALRIIFRCMIVVLNKRNFFQPGAPRWASLFSGPKNIRTSHSYKAFRREND